MPPPLPSGDPPDGTERRTAESSFCVLLVPLGESPSGAGESPALRHLTRRHLPKSVVAIFA